MGNYTYLSDCMMKIVKNTVVTFRYRLMDAQNNVIDDGQEPIVYLHGGYEDTHPSLEKAMDGQKAGFSTMIQIEPEQAFGEYDPMLLRIEERDKFPEGLEVGMVFESVEETDGQGNPVFLTVTDIVEGKVVLDGNHPLAGMALRIELTVESVRQASEEEISRGSMNALEEGDENGVIAGKQFRSMVLH